MLNRQKVGEHGVLRAEIKTVDKNY